MHLEPSRHHPRFCRNRAAPFAIEIADGFRRTEIPSPKTPASPRTAEWSLWALGPYRIHSCCSPKHFGREAIETGYVLKQIIDAGVRVFFYLEDRERTLDTAMTRSCCP